MKTLLTLAVLLSTPAAFADEVVNCKSENLVISAMELIGPDRFEQRLLAIKDERVLGGPVSESSDARATTFANDKVTISITKLQHMDLAYPRMRATVTYAGQEPLLVICEKR